MLNRQDIIGRVGQAPELKYLAGGQSVCNISVATSEKWTGKDGQQQEHTEWFNCVAYGKLAEVLAKAEKGSLLYISGKTKTRSWDDKETGKKVYAKELIVGEFKFLSKKSSGSSDQNGNGESSFNDNDIQF
jgi:single-strand DNA-binding protein